VGLFDILVHFEDPSIHWEEIRGAFILGATAEMMAEISWDLHPE
jgi:hypothetical protein